MEREERGVKKEKIERGEGERGSEEEKEREGRGEEE